MSVNALNVGDTMVMYGTTMFFIETIETKKVNKTWWTNIGIYFFTSNFNFFEEENFEVWKEIL